MLADKDFIRYSRQILLPECGETGQQRLMQSRVAIIGVGGLGCQVAQLLAAAGVGELWLFDDDSVELSNLPRQLLFDEADIGSNKAMVAAAKLKHKYATTIYAVGRLDERQINLLADFHYVVDCSDNFATRHLLAEYCFKKHKTLISGAIAAFEGLLFLQAAHCDEGKSGCYHCLFPKDTESAMRCASQGVLGGAVAAIAALQAQMVQQLILGMSLPSGRLQRFDFRHFRWYEAKVAADPHCSVCAAAQETELC